MTLLDAGAAAASQAGKYVLPEGLRLLHYHKQRTSARLRFLMFASGLVAPGPLDPTAVLLPGPPWSALGRVIAHPAAVASACAGHFGLSREALCVDAEFRLHGEELGRPFTLLLAEFLTVDPPFDPAARVGGRFVAITEARGLGNAEREALRLAYSHILG